MIDFQSCTKFYQIQKRWPDINLGADASLPHPLQPHLYLTWGTLKVCTLFISCKILTNGIRRKQREVQCQLV